MADLPFLDGEAPIAFDLLTHKDKITAKCFLSQESVNLLKTYLPTIQNNRIKPSLIEQILNQQIPTDEVGKALLKPLYEYVVQELPKLPSHYQKDIIQKLLSIEKTSAKDILLQEQWEKVYEMAK